MYAELGREAVAEHWGGIAEASSELSRFRNGVTEHIPCPICGHRNDINHRDRGCRNTLFEVCNEDRHTRNTNSYNLNILRAHASVGPNPNLTRT